MQKILKVNKPPIITYPQLTHTLSIISQEEHYIPWLDCHLIQLYSNCDDPRFPMISFFPMNGVQKLCPFIEVERVCRRDIKKEKLFEFICNCIDEEKYILCLTDTFYISAYRYWHKTMHRSHELLVFGYDKTSNTLQAADFFFDHYDFQTIPVDEFLEAYIAMDDSEKRQRDGGDQGYIYDEYHGELEVLKYQKNTRVEFDKDTFISQLRDYLLSENNTAVPLPDNYSYGDEAPLEKDIFGLKSFDRLALFLELLMKKVQVSTEVRSFHCLWEHKKAMLKKIKSVEQRNLISSHDKFSMEYMTVVERVNKLRLQMIKLNLRSKNENSKLRYLEKMIKELLEVKEIEKEILYKLLNRMEAAEFRLYK